MATIVSRLLLLVALFLPALAVEAAGGGSWEKRAALLEPNSETAVAQLDGKVYVVGGYPSSRFTVSTVQVYDPAKDTWALAAPLPEPLNHTMAAAVGGRLFVIGGQTSTRGNALMAGFVNSVYAYDPASDKWTKKAPMPTERSSGVTGVIDGRIYVAGGRPPHGHDFAVYDPAGDSWQVLPKLPTQRNHLAAGVAGGKFYVIGGRFGPGFRSELTAVVEVYDPKSKSWSKAAPLPKPRGGLNGIAARGCIHTFGGEGDMMEPNGLFPDHDVYDPRTNTWKSLDPLPIPIHGVTGLAFVGGVIFLPGGGTSIGGSSGSTLHQAFRPALSCQ